MEAERFDAITKTWGSVPRRRLLAGLVVGTLGPLLGLSTREASAQSCRHSCQCAAEETCVHKLCVPECGDPLTCNTGGGTGCPVGCGCRQKPGGGNVCAINVGCIGAQGCTKQQQCPAGQICTTLCCSPSPKFVCQAACIE